jgi:hypothetical protein
MNQTIGDINICKSPNEEVHWMKLIWYFTLQGTFTYFTLKNEAILKLEVDLVPIFIWLIIMGLIYGCVCNITMCFLIKITGNIFKATNSFRKILHAFELAYHPHLYTVALIILHITIAHYFDSSIIQNNLVSLFGFMLLLKIAIGILALWTIILLINGLKVAQNLTLSKTILNYLLAGILFAPFYYFLLMRN